MTDRPTPPGARVACPDCKLDLVDVPSGSVVARRCARCRGIWLDPASFRTLCEEETRPPDTEGALSPPQAARGRSGAAPRDERVRYRPCPACGEVMNRTNFGKVSGVVLDVCRPHGAWFDRGELAAIRRFLRAGGLGRYERLRAFDRERQARSRTAPAPPVGGTSGDIYDVILGDDGWGLPSRIPRLPLAAVCAALGVWGLWEAFHPDGRFSRHRGTAPLLFGLTCLYLAWRALGDWAARRRS